MVLLWKFVIAENGKDCCEERRDLSTWQESWSIFPTTASWSVETRIPMTSDFADSSRQERGKFKYKKRLRRFMMPLLLAYKLKFFTLIPVLIGGLVLLTGATGLAGFFFALFAAVMGLKSSQGGHRSLVLVYNMYRTNI
ncbi:hypothetical protein JTB14_035742 [Gonioctena quinquepunctata]|nr:hypothetical protein JTB14_035742 [Gonioctena quinquepunctata]